MDFCVLEGCPVPASIAPYIYLVTKRAGQKGRISSIFRGDSAKSILHKYGKHTQREIYATYPPGVANPPGFSSHELRSDGNAAYHVARGKPIPEWQVGVDSGGNSASERAAITKAAAYYGWKVVHPYSAGVEGHHWSFAKQPKPKNKAQAALISMLRARFKYRK